MLEAGVLEVKRRVKKPRSRRTPPRLRPTLSLRDLALPQFGASAAEDCDDLALLRRDLQ
jgi:hypothetical protein